MLSTGLSGRSDMLFSILEVGGGVEVGVKTEIIYLGLIVN